MTETTETVKQPMQNIPEQPQLLVEESGYEKEDVNARVIIIMFIIGTVTIGTIMFLLSEYFTSRKEAQVQAANAVVSSTYRDVRAREEERLNAYKLVNEQNGVYQIPINEAMKLLVNEAYERKLKESQPPPVADNAKPIKDAKKKDAKKDSKSKAAKK
jgi:tRNA(Met) C34 N-acetyltransferase TmcA